MIVSGSDDNTVRLWNIETGKELILFEGHQGSQGSVTSVAYSPAGNVLVSGSLDKTVRFWDLSLYLLFFHDSNSTPFYHTFIEAVKFLWQVDVEGIKIVHKERSPEDLEKYGTLLAPPPPGQSKFDQVLEWAEKQQGK